MLGTPETLATVPSVVIFSIVRNVESRDLANMEEEDLIKSTIPESFWIEVYANNPAGFVSNRLYIVFT